MTREEQLREKELKRLIFIKNELIKESKKEVKTYRNELNQLGKPKVKTKVRK